jgi:signal peptide peptidase SppA
VNRGAWIGANSGLTSYEGIGAQLDDATNDSEIKSILIDMNSYGGEATGMFSLAAKVRAASKKKRVVAVVNDVAASAGYGIVAGADEIIVSPTSLVGSIGVVMMHLDRSGEMQMKGLRPTFIHAGAHKVDGNPFGPLSDEVRASLQRDVNTLYDRFLETVASGRGSRLSVAKARATEAKTFFGQDAIDRGLADRIGTFEEVLSDLNRPAASSGGTSKKGTSRMEDDKNITATGISPEAHNAAVTAARNEGVAAGRKEGATEATARIKTILTCDEAKGREATAQTLALDTSMSAEEASKLLATLPTSAPASASAPEVPTIAQRAAGMPEMGGNDQQQPSAEVVKSSWSKAMDKTRAR